MNPSYEKPFTFDRVVRIVIGLLVAIGLYILVNKLSGVLLPFLVAWFLAYMIHPLVQVFQYKLKIKNRIASIILTLTAITAVIVGILSLIVPPIINEVIRTGDLFSVYIQQIQQASFISNDLKVFLVEWMNKIDIDKLLSQDNLSQGVETIVPQLVSIISGSIDIVISFFVLVIVFLYTVFILVDYEKITDGWIEFVPKKFRSRIAQMIDDLQEGMNKYFRGQAAISLIIGVLTAIGFEIIDLPLGILLGIIIGVFTMIPYLKVVMIPPLAFFALLKSIETGQSFWMVMLYILIIFVIIQTFEMLILTPKIMGKAMGMNPAVILLALCIWGALLGVVGLIIALPMTTVIVSYYKRFILGDEMLFEPTEKLKQIKKKTTKKPTKKKPSA